MCIKIRINNKVVNYYPATFNSTSKSATSVLNQIRVFNKDIMILCTSEPERLRWKYVINTSLLQGDILNKIVSAGQYLNGAFRYIAKVFHENQWKISTVYEYGYSKRGLYIWTNVDGSGVPVKDCKGMIIYDILKNMILFKLTYKVYQSKIKCDER